MTIITMFIYFLNFDCVLSYSEFFYRYIQQIFNIHLWITDSSKAIELSDWPTAYK